LGSSENLDEIVVNGIRRGDLILPTQVTSTSAYGLDLGVMDTPRNNSLISKAQLDALNIQNPGGFSYLTSSSYSDASFGVPNVPKIRGQYADIFYDGMRDPFTLNGYGAPISFNDVDSIDIVKGTASVQQGPGAGVGGAIGITTKTPSFTKWSEAFNLEFDSQQKRRASFDVGVEYCGARQLRLRRQRQLLLRHVFPPAIPVCRGDHKFHRPIQRAVHGRRGR
jgi:outer membrane receptor protein involved in Fe transport